MIAGIDIGGTKTDAVLLHEDGSVAHRVRSRTGFGGDSVVSTTVAAIDELARRAGRAVADFQSIGVGVPGSVAADGSRVTHAVNLGFEDLDLGGALGQHFGRPVYVENDVNAAAMGAFMLLDLPPSSSLAYLNLGTGLAAGVVMNGELWRGSRGTAGEIGHIGLQSGTEVCACGQVGCLELSASGSAIARQWPGGNPPFFEQLALGNPSASLIWENLCIGVASAVQLLLLTLDVDSVIVGGGLTSAGPPLRNGVHSHLDEMAIRSPFLSSLQMSKRMSVLPPDLPAAVTGAAWVGAAR